MRSATIRATELKTPQSSATHPKQRNLRVGHQPSRRGPDSCVIHVGWVKDKAETMQVPYAKKWQKETARLRKIALDCYLTEELKWGKPCFTFLKKNVAIVIPLKESCALSFFKGALLKDPKHILERIGERTQAGRWIKFTSLREIAAVRSTLKNYLYEAIELEESGAKIDLKKPSEYPIPEELQKRLDHNAVLR